MKILYLLMIVFLSLTGCLDSKSSPNQGVDSNTPPDIKNNELPTGQGEATPPEPDKEVPGEATPPEPDKVQTPPSISP